MYLLHKILLFLGFPLLTAGAYYLNLKVDSDFSSNLFTFAGIMFGFIISASVAMKGSNFLSRQSRMVDKSACGLQMSNLQRLCAYIYSASVSNLLLIVILILFSFLPRYEILIRCCSSLILGIVGVVIFLSFLLLRIVLKFLMSQSE